MIRFERVSFTYPQALVGQPVQPALRGIDLTIPAGAFALVSGVSGAGKSTLLRCINGLVPHFTGGVLKGDIRVAGVNPALSTPQRMSSLVGFVFQDPESQFVVDRVEDEIAFALENARLPGLEIGRRVDEALNVFGLAGLRGRRLTALSGGEKQRVAIAAALAPYPHVLALDEPTSQLDPDMAAEVLQWLLRLRATLGLTLVLAEHRLERVLPFADLMVHLSQQGGSVISGPPAEVVSHLEQTPPVIALGKALGWHPLPLTVEDALQAHRVPAALRPRLQAPTEESRLAPVLQAAGLEVTLQGAPILRGVDLELRAGEIAVLMGPNGAGKTTLLRSLVGLVSPQQGEIRLAGTPVAGWGVAEICRRVGYLPQDPSNLLFAETVADELSTTLQNHGIRESSAPVERDGLLEQLGLLDSRDRYPRDLSAGERQRVALGAIMITKPKVLLLDEPTRGLDYAAKRGLLEILRAWRAEGVSILLVTHDVELAAQAADTVLLMRGGRIVAHGAPAVVLRSSLEFTPQIARLFPETGWLTLDDALSELLPPR